MALAPNIHAFPPVEGLRGTELEIAKSVARAAGDAWVSDQGMPSPLKEWSNAWQIQNGMVMVEILTQNESPFVKNVTGHSPPAEVYYWRDAHNPFSQAEVRGILQALGVPRDGIGFERWPTGNGTGTFWQTVQGRKVDGAGGAYGFLEQENKSFLEFGGFYEFPANLTLWSDAALLSRAVDLLTCQAQTKDPQHKPHEIQPPTISRTVGLPELSLASGMLVQSVTYDAGYNLDKCAWPVALQIDPTNGQLLEVYFDC